MEYNTRSHAWLTTYAPYNNPQYVVTVLVEHGGHGGSAAGQLLHKFIDGCISMDILMRIKSLNS